MSFTLDQVVPWGRSHDEYVAMLALSDDDLKRRIVGCGDGPSSFNSVLSGNGGRVVSVDPLYGFSADQIKKRIDETCDIVMDQVLDNVDEFVWQHISSPNELRRVRMGAMSEFLADYPAGSEEKRYQPAGLPELPFAAQSFDIALCSHFLFLYSERHDEDFHVRSIVEMCRVASEARIFPVLELGARPSRHLESVTARLREQGYRVELERVAYELQKGGNELMKVTKA